VVVERCTLNGIGRLTPEKDSEYPRATCAPTVCHFTASGVPPNVQIVYVLTVKYFSYIFVTLLQIILIAMNSSWFEGCTRVCPKVFGLSR